VKVRGKWTYLYRAVDKFGNTIDFYLSPTRNAKAAKRFLGKALNGLKDWEKPTVINTDKAPTYGIAISELKAEDKCLLPLVRLRRRNDGWKRQPPRARATNHKQLGNTVSSILSSMRCSPVQCVSGESKLTAAYQRALVDQILQIAGGGSA
jgi:transposase-like protein